MFQFDVCYFDRKETKEWTELPNDGFSARRGHAAVVFDKLMMVHGGLEEQVVFENLTVKAYLDDILIFDLESKKWGKIEEMNMTIRNKPTARNRHLAVIHAYSLYVFGGITGGSEDRNMNDIHRMSLLTDVWIFFALMFRSHHLR